MKTHGKLQDNGGRPQVGQHMKIISKNYLRNGIFPPKQNPNRICQCPAHGYYTSGFDNATILCMDSIGEWKVPQYGLEKETSPKKVYSLCPRWDYSQCDDTTLWFDSREEYKAVHMAKRILTTCRTSSKQAQLMMT